jgi:hypothetical protein
VLPHFITEIDGLDIHFIHVRSKHENALPLIVTHGWPGSVVEQLKIIEPLTDPTAHGGNESDAFHLVIPSMPGYGFSGKPTTPGWGPVRIAQAWIKLMQRLGYTRYVAQGGDWGSLIVDLMAFTPTWPVRFQPRSQRHSSWASPRRPISQPTRNTRSTGWTFSLSSTSPTHSRWGRVHRHSTALQIHLSAWLPG